MHKPVISLYIENCERFNVGTKSQVDIFKKAGQTSPLGFSLSCDRTARTCNCASLTGQVHLSSTIGSKVPIRHWLTRSPHYSTSRRHRVARALITSTNQRTAHAHPAAFFITRSRTNISRVKTEKGFFYKRISYSSSLNSQSQPPPASNK